MSILVTLLIATLVAVVVKLIGDRVFPKYADIAAFVAFIVVVLVRLGAF